jgi:hypothetical protein
VKSIRSEFEEQGELCTGEGSVGGVNVMDEFFDSAIVSCVGEMVESDGECVGGWVWDEIGIYYSALATGTSLFRRNSARRQSPLNQVERTFER